MNTITLLFPSLTYAQKSKHFLLKKRINSKLVKYDPDEADGDCAYGLIISNSDHYGAVDTLINEGIPYKIR